MTELDTLIQQLQQRPGIKAVLKTKRTLVIWFNDDYKVVIESYSGSQIDVSIINAAGETEVKSPQSVALYRIQIFIRGEWSDYTNIPDEVTSSDLEKLEPKTRELSKGTPCKLRIIDSKNSVWKVFQHGHPYGEEQTYFLQSGSWEGGWSDIQCAYFHDLKEAREAAKGYSKNTITYRAVRIIDFNSKATVTTYEGGKVVQ